MTALVPPALHPRLAASLYATRLFNVTVTNVPGPQLTLYAFGAPLREIHPLVPLMTDHAVGVAIVSYDGKVFFGVNADRDTVEDLGEMVEGMNSALVDLGMLAAAHA